MATANKAWTPAIAVIERETLLGLKHNQTQYFQLQNYTKHIKQTNKSLNIHQTKLANHSIPKLREKYYSVQNIDKNTVFSATKLNQKCFKSSIAAMGRGGGKRGEGRREREILLR